MSLADGDAAATAAVIANVVAGGMRCQSAVSRVCGL
jgi:hypothetical protein